MHTDKMNCSPSQIIPYIKLFFVGHITMMEFVITGQSVNLFINYWKKELTQGKASQQHAILVFPSNTALKQFTQIQKSENMDQTKQLSSQNKSVNLLSESQHLFLESIKHQAQIPTMSSDHLLSTRPCHYHIHTLPTLQLTSKNSSKPSRQNESQFLTSLSSNQVLNPNQFLSITPCYSHIYTLPTLQSNRQDFSILSRQNESQFLTSLSSNQVLNPNQFLSTTPCNSHVSTPIST